MARNWKPCPKCGEKVIACFTLLKARGMSELEIVHQLRKTGYRRGPCKVQGSRAGVMKMELDIMNAATQP